MVPFFRKKFPGEFSLIWGNFVVPINGVIPPCLRGLGLHLWGGGGPRGLGEGGEPGGGSYIK